jgi:hypothetical protein
MGLFKKKSTDPAELELIKADIVAMAARLDRTDAEKAALAAHMQGIVDRLDTPAERLTTPTPAPPAPPAPPANTPPPPPPSPPAVTSADFDMLSARLQRLSDRLDTVDTRITSIATELANQLTELSGDVEALGNREQVIFEPSSNGQDDTLELEIVNEIRDAQVRLANEQARYQIAFRADLADLVEKLRRS